MEFERLFEPIMINGLEIKNRIVMPAMGLLYTFDYSFNDRHRAFYRERAKGGVGLLTLGPIAVDQVGCAPVTIGLFDDRQVGPLKALVEEIHGESETKVGIQLIHMGRYAFSFLSGLTPIAPSALASKLTGETPREMTREDIEEVQQAYVRSALRAKEAGFDYIEILACTGYLISQFLSPITNQRNDEYGGSIENRMRFGLEVIHRVRQAVGDHTPLGMRVSGNDFMKGGHTNRESSRFAVEAQKIGINAVNVTGGWHETAVPQLTSDVPAGVFLYLARGIKEKVSIPVFASNRLGDPEVAERALRAGSCDLICWGRPLLADPELPKKVKEGRRDEIISCISCNQGCFDPIFSGNPVGCILNPRTGREQEFHFQKAPIRKKIMVAGGGPAGMEFALTAAQRGHELTLYESKEQLGGQVNLAMAAPGKEEFGKIISSLKTRMARWGVTVKLNTPVTPELVQREKPDLLVVASGARPIALDLPGVDKSQVVSAWDVLQEKVSRIGKRVVIVGGNATGCEAAHFIGVMGIPDADTFTFLMYHLAETPDLALKLLHEPTRQITIIEMADKVANNVSRSSRWSLLKSLRLLGVEIRTRTRLMEISDDAVKVLIDGREEIIPADTVVMATGVKSVNDLKDPLEDMGVELITLGDAGTPGKIGDAIKQGFEAALNL
ncbi:MAG: NADH:flavin oxidoreductase [Desulfobacca sp.]|nr:NADH:flavin oxidoreductase [Desulfobacca sp.]